MQLCTPGRFPQPPTVTFGGHDGNRTDVARRGEGNSLTNGRPVSMRESPLCESEIKARGLRNG